MTLPSSGAISISQIAAELRLPSNTSLRVLSAAASGKSAPDSFSEFYGYTYREMVIYYTSNSEMYNQAGYNITNYNWEIIGTEAWYVVLNNYDIPYLTFNPMNDSDGYYSPATFGYDVGPNNTGNTLYGSADIYWTRDNTYAGTIYCVQQS